MNRLLACLVLGPVVLAGVAAAAQPRTLETLERSITANPEDLLVAAEYRQLAIAGAQFDRAINFLDRLAGRRGSGPNVKISVALARVDKVPTSGDWSRLFLGNDAIDSLTKSIEQRPSVLAYYIRGVINLYYNNIIFKRIPRGIADLEKALALVTPDTPDALVARIYMSLGDGHWRLGQKQKARDAWTAGITRFPASPALQIRTSPDEGRVEGAVSDTLYAGNRVDTSLRETLP